MNISEHHPSAIELDKEYIMIRRLVESFEEKIRSGDDKYSLLLKLKDLRDRIYDYQIQKFGHYVNRQELPKAQPPAENSLIDEIVDLEKRIDIMMNKI